MANGSRARRAGGRHCLVALPETGRLGVSDAVYRAVKVLPALLGERSW